MPLLFFMGVALAVALALSLLGFCCWRRLKRSRAERRDDSSATTLPLWRADSLRKSDPGLGPAVRPMLESGSIPHEQLRFKEELGRGAFGVVRLATWQGDEWAVKTLHACHAAGGPAQEELRREFELVRCLRSPRIIQVMGTATDPQTRCLCIIMEYASGGTLRRQLDKGVPELAQQLQWALDVAQGMAFLHHNRVTHCDLKSANVLLDKNRRGKVADFGLSKVTQPEGAGQDKQDATCTNAIKGSPSWMAPEAIRGARKMASDMYSFAIVLWELRTAGYPWLGLPFVTILYKVTFERSRPPLPDDEHVLDALMKELWDETWQRRPPFDQCVQRLEEMRGPSAGHQAASFEPPAAQPPTSGDASTLGSSVVPSNQHPVIQQPPVMQAGLDAVAEQ